MTMKMRHLNRRKVSLIFSVLMLLFTWACGSLTKKSQIGSHISGPFDVKYSLLSNTLYVLNSSFSGDYKSGSLGVYDANPGSDPQLLNAIEIPRLGTEMTLSADGSLLAIAFSDERPLVKIYAVTDRKNLNFLYDVSFDDKNLRDLSFFKPTQSQQWYFTAAINPKSALAQTRVWRLPLQDGSSHNAVPETVLEFPRDVMKIEDFGFQLGYTHPLFIESLQALVVLPTAGENVPHVPGAYDFLSQKITEPIELRSVSLLLIDFQNGSPAPSSALQLVPVAYTSEGLKADVSSAVDAPINSGLGFHNAFALGFSLPSACGGVLKDSLFLAENRSVDGRNRSDIFMLKGLNTILSENRSGHILTPLAASQLLLTSAFSRNVGKSSAFDDISNEIVDYKSAYSADKSTCIPVWQRQELGRNNAGREAIHIQYAAPAQDYGAVQLRDFLLPTRGARRFVFVGFDVVSLGFFADHIDRESSAIPSF